MSVIDDFFKDLTVAIGGLAVGSLKNYKEQVVKDGQAFAEKLKKDLEVWTDQMKKGELTPAKFEWLVKGKKDLAELLALKEKGLAEAALNKFFNDLVGVIVSAATKFFPKIP